MQILAGAATRAEAKSLPALSQENITEQYLSLHSEHTTWWVCQAVSLASEKANQCNTSQVKIRQFRCSISIKRFRCYLNSCKYLTAPLCRLYI